MKADIKIEDVEQVMDSLGINKKVIKPEYFKNGMMVEMEHGKVNKLTNVTHNSLKKTGKIALAHLLEMPDYYTRLERLEKNGKKYWENRNKPQILKKKANKSKK